MLLCPFERVSVCLIADDNGELGGERTGLNVVDDGLEVGTAAGDEHAYRLFFSYPAMPWSSTVCSSEVTFRWLEGKRVRRYDDWELET